MRSSLAMLMTAAVLLLTGCAGNQVVPEDQYYRIAPAAPEHRYESPLLDAGVVVAAVDATAIYQDRAIVYREAQSPLRLKRHHYHHWADSPAQLLQQYLLEYLGRANLAEQIHADRYGIEARYRLRTRLKQFDQVYRTDGVGVHVALAFELTDQASGERIALQDAEQTLFRAGETGMHTTVELFQAAVGQLTATWVEQLAGQLRAQQ